MDPIKTYDVNSQYRVVVNVDEIAEKPDWGNSGDFPVFTIEYLGWYKCVPLNGAAEYYEDYINNALSQWGRDYGMVERYLRAFHGATKLDWTSYDRGSDIFIFDPQAEVEARGISPEYRLESMGFDLATWSAWASGDVYMLTLEERLEGTLVYAAEDTEDEPWEEWREVETVGGYYGDDEITDDALKCWAYDVARI